MAYIDIAILVVIGLSFIIGIVKGFWRSFAKIIAFVGAVVAGILLADKLFAVMPVALSEWVNSGIGKIFADNAVANMTITGTEGNFSLVGDGGASMEMSAAYAALHIPTTFQNMINGALTAGSTLGACVTGVISKYIVLFICGLIIFLVCYLVLRIISRIIFKFVNEGYLRGVDRVLGGVFRIALGIFWVIVILYVFTFLANFDFMNPVIEEINKSTIAKFFYEKNLLNMLFEKVTDMGIFH